MKLTDEQKAKMEAEAVTPLMKEAREKLTALLTPEQKEQLKKEMKARRGAQGGTQLDAAHSD